MSDLKTLESPRDLSLLVKDLENVIRELQASNFRLEMENIELKNKSEQYEKK